MVSMSSKLRPQSGPVSRSDVARSTCSVSLRSYGSGGADRSFICVGWVGGSVEGVGGLVSESVCRAVLGGGRGERNRVASAGRTAGGGGRGKLQDGCMRRSCSITMRRPACCCCAPCCCYDGADTVVVHTTHARLLALRFSTSCSRPFPTKAVCSVIVPANPASSPHRVRQLALEASEEISHAGAVCARKIGSSDLHVSWSREGWEGRLEA